MIIETEASNTQPAGIAGERGKTMLWIGKAKDPFLGETFTWKIDAGNALDAQRHFEDVLRRHNPFFAAVADAWVEPADDQPEDVKTFAVFCYDHGTGRCQNNYPDTYDEAKDLADVMSNFYDDVEICYGWPGHWQHYDQDDVGMRLYAQYYTEEV